MRINKLWLLLIGVLSAVVALPAVAPAEENGKKKLVIVAGKPSHPKRMHEFKAGSTLLVDCQRCRHGFSPRCYEWVADG